ncbi:MAG: GerAB/ArcD/ProY family transporter [Eubacterium sp.]|nr:GerAB/ArcD/ProY family transporter [Eubacterium sp.]
MNEVKAMKKADDFNNRQEEIDILMSCPDALSGRQLTRMLYVEGFGAAGLTYPAVAAAADTGGRGGLAFVFYGAFLLVYAGWLVCSSWKKALPPWAAGIYIIRFLVNAAALIFFFGCSIRNIYMPDHSLFWLLIPFVVLLWYCTETNLQKHARFVELLFPWIAFLFALLILAASAGLLFKIGGTAGGIAPAGTSAGLPGGIRGGYGLLLCSSSLEFICFLLPSCIMPEKRAVKPGLNIEASGERIKADKSNGFLFKRYVLKGILGGYLCNFLLWFVTVQSLGRAVTASTYWPVVKVMQLISLPGGFLERFDILLVVYWILCMIGVLSGYLYYARRLAEDTFFARWPDHVKKKRMAAFTGIILFCIYVIACLLPDLDRTISIYGWYKAWIDLPLILLLPFLIGRRKKIHLPVDKQKKRIC